MLFAHLHLEVGSRIERPVGVVLHRHLGQGRAVDPESVHIAVGGQRKQAGRGGARLQVRMDALALQAAHRPVLQLFGSQHQHQLVPASRHRRHRIAQSVGARGAVVLHPGDRTAKEPQGVGQRDGSFAPAETRRKGSQPGGLHVLQPHAGILAGGRRRFHHHVLQALLDVVAEFGAAHADHRYLVSQRLSHHALLGRHFQK